MNIYVDEIPDNCNKCMFVQNMSQHWDINDYCDLNKLSIGRFEKASECPLKMFKGINKTLEQ